MKKSFPLCESFLILLAACTSCSSHKKAAEDAKRPSTKLLGYQQRVLAEQPVDHTVITMRASPDAVAGIAFAYRSATDYDAILVNPDRVMLFTTLGGRDQIKELPLQGVRSPVQFTFQEDKGQMSLLVNGQVAAVMTTVTGKVAALTHRGSAEFEIEIPGVEASPGRVITP